MKKNLTFRQKAAKAEKRSRVFVGFSNVFFAGVFIALILAFVSTYLHPRYFIYLYTACMACGIMMLILRYFSFLASCRANKFWNKHVQDGEQKNAESFDQIMKQITEMFRQSEDDQWPTDEDIMKYANDEENCSGEAQIST